MYILSTVLLKVFSLLTHTHMTHTLHMYIYIYTQMAGKSKQVLHLQFISWPDHGVPEYAGPTLTYLRRVKAESKSTKGTALFHCRYM